MYDVVSVKFPHYNFLLLLDQSSGHGRMREGSLNANVMSSKFGGKQEKLRDTQIKEVGPYQAVLEVGSVQSMSFKEGDRGPFYLVDDSHRIKRKFDRNKGEKKMVTKSKKEIKEELKIKGVFVRGHCPRDKIEKLATDNNIELTYQKNVVEEGWMGNPKGLLQVLWERGWIDETKIDIIPTHRIKCTKP